jgi:hypothetical protein
VTAAGGTGPRERDDGMPREPDDGAIRPGPAKADDKPVLPVKSVDETSVGWGEAPEPDDEERLRQDRPPHWDE